VLIINCGNGWVERCLFDSGLFVEVIGIDNAQDLLDAAATAMEGRPLRYVRRDINDADLVEGGFDFVINHAAAHNSRVLDRVFRKIALALPPDGIFLKFDYVGPHRNQYSKENWRALRLANDSLPECARATMEFPDLSAILRIDTSQAVHSKLIIPTFGIFILYIMRRREALLPTRYLPIMRKSGRWSCPKERGL
jgi:SAM-dependent methyltransferase